MACFVNSLLTESLVSLPVTSLTFCVAIAGVQTVGALQHSLLFSVAAGALHFQRCCIAVGFMSPLHGLVADISWISNTPSHIVNNVVYRVLRNASNNQLCSWFCFLLTLNVCQLNIQCFRSKGVHFQTMCSFERYCPWNSYLCNYWYW